MIPSDQYSSRTSTHIDKKREREMERQVSHVETSRKAGRTYKKVKSKDSSTEPKRKFNFIRDQYTEARGEPKMLEITCKKCHAWLIDYQKDGPGNLLRCYADRIYHPTALRERTFTAQTINNIEALKCAKCGIKWAIPIIYHRTLPKPEVRPAYVILKDSNGPVVRYNERIK